MSRQQPESVDELAQVLEDMARARDLASSESHARILLAQRRVYPMSLVASQLTINPFEFLMLIALLITGIAYLFVGVSVPGSISKVLPPVWTYVWVINLGLGSLSALCGGLYRRNPDKGLLMYQFGWGMCGLGTGVYGAAVLLAFPTVGLYPGVTNLLIAAASIMRVLQIQRFFRVADLMRKGILRIPFFEAADGGGSGSGVPPGGTE